MRSLQPQKPRAQTDRQKPQKPPRKRIESYASAPDLINPGSRSHGSNFRLKETGVYYSSLPEVSLKLDRQLYSLLKVSIKGTKQNLLKQVSFPSYVQGMIVLHRHCQLSHNQRKTEAMAEMERLKFKTNVHDWQVQAVSAFQELIDSGCTIMDFGLSCLMKSLQGKSKTIQYRIADDINSKDNTEHSSRQN